MRLLNLFFFENIGVRMFFVTNRTVKLVKKIAYLPILPQTTVSFVVELANKQFLRVSL